ncbi:hypothetical protein FOL47_004827 [Perkinsus chesapeaki]|uniref:Uncharacterized protein n=1 Tax=Perkinsus chesapeaki TaxID=330153 RepID=A0A7J6M0D3_PERCH|nr:hypothetical protein FOL47_004827 [Perkinsus chesapeaki]
MRLGEPSSHNDPPIAAPHTQQAATPAPNGMQTAATGESPKEEPLPQELPPIVLDNKAKSPLLMAADITTAVLETSQKRVAAVLTKTRERLLDFPEFSDDLSDALISDKIPHAQLYQTALIACLVPLVSMVPFLIPISGPLNLPLLEWLPVLSLLCFQCCFMFAPWANRFLSNVWGDNSVKKYFQIGCVAAAWQLLWLGIIPYFTPYWPLPMMPLIGCATILAIVFMIYFSLPLEMRVLTSSRFRILGVLLSVGSCIVVFGISYPFLFFVSSKTAGDIRLLVGSFFYVFRAIFERVSKHFAKKYCIDCYPMIVLFAMYAYEFFISSVISSVKQLSVAILLIGLDLLENAYYLLCIFRARQSMPARGDICPALLKDDMSDQGHQKSCREKERNASTRNKDTEQSNNPPAATPMECASEAKKSAHRGDRQTSQPGELVELKPNLLEAPGGIHGDSNSRRQSSRSSIPTTAASVHDFHAVHLPEPVGSREVDNPDIPKQSESWPEEVPSEEKQAARDMRRGSHESSRSSRRGSLLELIGDAVTGMNPKMLVEMADGGSKRSLCIVSIAICKEVVEILAPLHYLLCSLMIRTFNSKLHDSLWNVTDEEYRDGLIRLVIDILAEGLLFALLVYFIQRWLGISVILIALRLSHLFFWPFIGMQVCLMTHYIDLQYTNAGMSFSFDFEWVGEKSSNVTWHGGYCYTFGNETIEEAC